MTIIDATVGGDRIHSFTLDALMERMTVREIIRARIYQEVQDYNRAEAERTGQAFRGLVQPTPREQALNGAMARGHRPIDWEAQFQRACDAFEANGFFLLVGDRQAESLDEAYDVGVDTEVQFVKLTPLVGG
jgi:hypothetical protein